MMKVQMMQTFSMIPSPILKNASQKFLLTANYQMKFLKKNQTILTVKKDEALSHQDLGWERLTDYIIKILNKKNESIVFILWGNFARSKKKLITNPKHLIIESAHPSPLSAYHGFFGSHPFSKTNNFLRENGREPVDFS